MSTAFLLAGLRGTRPRDVPIHERNPAPTRMTSPAVAAAMMMNRRGTRGAFYDRLVEHTRVKLPAGIAGAFDVYVNGVRQRAGEDYHVTGDELVFDRRLAKEGRLGFWRWLSLFLGVAGTYRQNDSVDVIYDVDGKRVVANGLPLTPE